MKYIRQFDSVQEMTEAMANTTVSVLGMAMDGNTPVIETKVVPPTPQHDYVEIGGIKWATMNVGANSITDSGLYFQWGDTQGYTASQVGSGSGQKAFTWADYKYCNGTGNVMTKYNSTDGKTVLDLSDDAVNAAWGGNWRMPTGVELQALGNAVNAVWTENYNGSGVNGLVCTDKTDSSKVLFFPAAGQCFNGSVRFVDGSGDYWTSSVSWGQYIFYLNLSECGASWHEDFDDRSYGKSVRGVLGE